MTADSDLTVSAVRLLLNLTLFGTPIAVGLAIAFKIARVASPRARYLIALLAFFVIAFFPVFLTFSRNSERALPSGSLFTASANLAETKSQEPATKALGYANPELRPILTLTDRLNPAIEQIAHGPLGSGLLVIWIVVALFLIVREIAGHVSIIRLRGTWKPAPETVRRNMAWPEGIPLLIHEQEWPCTVGFAHPTVVLPARLSSSLSTEAAQQVARHELSHAQWRDPLVNAGVRLVRAFLWPSLPLWFLERVIRAEREAAADRAAIQDLTPSDESAVADYATTLLSIAQACSHKGIPRVYSAAGTHIGAARLEERVHRLFKFSQPLTHTRLTLAGLILLCGVLAVGFVPITSRGLAPQALAEQRRQVVERQIIDFTNSPGAQRSTSAMNKLLSALKNRDWQVDGEVKSYLDQIRSSGTIEPLTITLADDKDWRVREKIAWSLGQLNDRRAVEPLIGALSDPAGEVKHTVAWALGIIGERRAVDPLIANLQDGNAEARHGAAWALGRIGDRRAVMPLIVLLKDKDSDVRHGAAWALGEIGDRRALEPLRTVFEDKDADVRAQAARSLAKVDQH